MSPSQDIPTIHIRPTRGWMSLDFREMWEYRELLYFLSLKDLKVRYRQTLLGVTWVILNPVVHTVVFTVIFGKLAGLPSDGLPAPVFYIIGLAVWRYFAGALGTVSDSLVGSSHLLTKIYFPRLLIPLTPCLTGLVDYAISFGIILVLMLYFQTLPAWTVLFLPLLVLIAVGAAFGVGIFFAALNVRYRDVRLLVPFITQIWMYASVIIPFSSLPERWGIWRYLYALNPMAGVVEGCRWCLAHHAMQAPQVTETILSDRIIPETLAQGQEIIVRVLADDTTQLVLRETTLLPLDAPWLLVGLGLPFTALALVFGLYYFKRVERMFADIV